MIFAYNCISKLLLEICALWCCKVFQVFWYVFFEAVCQAALQSMRCHSIKPVFVNRCRPHHSFLRFEQEPFLRFYTSLWLPFVLQLRSLVNWESCFDPSLKALLFKIVKEPVFGSLNSSGVRISSPQFATLDAMWYHPASVGWDELTSNLGVFVLQPGWKRSQWELKQEVACSKTATVGITLKPRQTWLNSHRWRNYPGQRESFKGSCRFLNILS